ncbi:hypothetical protein ACRBEV_07715 [Methylobacterium phyllosphaerae]
MKWRITVADFRPTWIVAPISNAWSTSNATPEAETFRTWPAEGFAGRGRHLNDLLLRHDAPIGSDRLPLQILSPRQRHELADEVRDDRAPSPDAHDEFLAGHAGDARFQRPDMADAAGQILAGREAGGGAEPDSSVETSAVTA